MAEWSRETPWRQGHVLTDDAVDKLGLRDAQAPEKTLAVVISHDCDLAASPEKEPDIELIVGTKLRRRTETSRTQRLRACFILNLQALKARNL